MSRLAWVNISCLQCRKLFTTRPSRFLSGNVFCGNRCRADNDMESSIDRFWHSITKAESGCWEWNGSMNAYGYGTISVGKNQMAHRFAWEKLKGTIPTGLQIDHLCRNRKCVNPDHLEPVEQKLNMARGVCPSAINAVKKFCKRGHSLDDALITPKGHRTCRICNRIRANLFRNTGSNSLKGML
jgi:hypothetical protein